MSFLELPSETICRILRLCDAVSIARCSLACKQLHKIVQGAEVQYSIMLDVLEIQDSGDSSRPVSERLRLLQEYEMACQSAGYTQVHEFTVKIARRAFRDFDFKDGILAVLGDPDPERDGTPNLASLNLESPHAPLPATTVVIHRVRSLVRNVAHKVWTWSFPAASAQGIVIDPAQDLALVMEKTASEELRCHPLTLSSGEPHPSAKGHFTVHFPGSGKDAFLYDSSILLVEESSSDGSPLVTWNVVEWTTGTVKQTSQIQASYSSIAFLSATCLLECKLSGEYDEESDSLLIHRFNADGSELEESIPLLLPGFCDPVDEFKPASHFLMHDLHVAADDSQDEDPLAIFYIDLTYYQMNECHLTLEIPLSSLLAYAEAPEEALPPDSRAFVTWENMLLDGAAIRPAATWATLKGIVNSRQWFMPAKWCYGPAVNPMMYADYGPLRVARALASGIPENSNPPDPRDAPREVDVFVGLPAVKGRSYRNLEGDKSGPGNPPKWCTFAIDRRPAHPIIFTSGHEGGVPRPRIIAIHPSMTRDIYAPLAGGPPDTDAFISIHLPGDLSRRIFKLYL